MHKHGHTFEMQEQNHEKWKLYYRKHLGSENPGETPFQGAQVPRNGSNPAWTVLLAPPNLCQVLRQERTKWAQSLRKTPRTTCS